MNDREFQFQFNASAFSTRSVAAKFCEQEKASLGLIQENGDIRDGDIELCVDKVSVALNEKLLLNESDVNPVE